MQKHPKCRRRPLARLSEAPNPDTSGILFRTLPIGSRIRATPAASLAGESRLKIRQAHVIRPTIPADRSPVRTVIIGAVDHQAANARGAHLCEGDLLAGWSGNAHMNSCDRREGVTWEYPNIRKCDNSATSYTLNCSLSYKHITLMIDRKVVCLRIDLKQQAG
jgi:hypothetical protein